MKQTNISPELAAALETSVTALEASASDFAVAAVTFRVAALAARAALKKALQPIADDAGGAV